jgi:phage-related protein
VFKIKYYETERGQKPVEEFIDTLEENMQVKVFRQIGLLKDYGNMLREPHSSIVGNGIYELRIIESRNIVRIFYFFKTGKTIVLTNGIVKKTQKLPSSAIKTAEQHKKDYERREEKR